MKNLLFDLLNGLTFHDFCLFFIQLFSALFIGQLVRIVVKLSPTNTSISPIVFAIVPLIFAFLVIISKNSAPLSISVLGAFIITGSIFKDSMVFDRIIVFVLASAGFGCASGYVLATILIYMVIVLPVIYFSKKIK